MSKVERNIPPLNPKVFKEVQRMSDEFLADFTSSLHEAKEREERKTDDPVITCPRCDGDGMVFIDGDEPYQDICPRCGGREVIDKEDKS